MAMSASHPSPCAVLDLHREPLLSLYNLTPEQSGWLWDVMVMNGCGPVQDARSLARAHLQLLDGDSGRAEILFFNADGDAYTEFMDYLTRELGVEVFDNVMGELRKRV